MSSSDSDKPAPAAIVAEQDALVPGTRFGELEIVRVLGVGGFGIVYLARDHSLERDVALKEYMPSALAVRGQGPQITVRSGALSETYAVGLRSFINEARLLAKFDHPSLVKVYRFWEDNATAYMVMPYLQGRTLREARRAMPAPPDEAWIRGVVTPILGAIEVLHRDGVFHRDIAPDNILLPHEGPPVLLDFGAARRVISDRTQSLTAILKPNYAPIEQYAEMTTLRQGPWTDLYALGAVVHFLLAGTPPVPATARAVQDEMQPLWTRAFPGVSQRFLSAIDWALAVRPQDRPQSVEALRAVMDGRAEPPVFPRTVPGSTSLMPVAPASYETTQVATVREPTAFPATVRDPAPARAAPAVAVPAPVPAPTTPPGGRSAPAPTLAAPSAAPVAPAAAPAVPAPSVSSSRKGLVGAALAVVAVLAAAAGWQVLESRHASTPPVAAEVAPPVTAVPPVAAQPEAPTAAPAPTPGPSPAPAVVAETPSAAPAASDPAPAVVATPQPQPAAAATPPRTAAAPVPRMATRAAPAADPAGDSAAETGKVETATDSRPHNPVPSAGAGEMSRAERVRAVREALRAQRQAAREEAPPPARTANVPLGAQLPGTIPLGAPQPGDVPLGAAPSGPATAREACGGRVLVALWTCLQRECRKPRYALQADCQRVNEERRARELQ